jgi:DNA modification methylase
MKSTLNTRYNVESRRISEIVPKEVKIQTTISSPPYFDMKDYGTENQIGFGQSYEEYLRDIKSVFEQVYQYTKDDGTLWIIIDTFKRNDSIVLLPFDLASKLKESGWLLQDIIIWKKDKTVPWSNNGFTQRKFEYVLFFSKSPKFKNNKDKVRVFDTRQLKKWWVKYPERYNPRGKALDEIWEYPIPVQGSWGKQYIRHFCPLPQDMVSNMILISTDEGDVVFDPFAGSGTVLSQSAYMNRPYLGFELNRSYIEKFHSYLSGTLGTGKANYEKMLKKEGQAVFEEQILDLRALKYGRMLVRVIQEGLNLYSKVLVERIRREGSQSVVKYSIVGVSEDMVEGIIAQAISKSPLSKYEIIPVISYQDEINEDKSWSCYSITNSHSYMKDVTYNDPRVRVLSPIKVNLSEKDYD